jgi:ankyrin repeat protein
MRPLHAAVLAGQRHVVEWLLAQGVEPDPPVLSEWGVSSQMTPLLTAISSSLPDITLLLIENGCSVNRVSRWGYPLHDAISTRSDPEIVEALLAHGADSMLRYQDKTVVDLAKESKSKHRDRYLELLEAAIGN